MSSQSDIPSGDCVLSNRLTVHKKKKTQSSNSIYVNKGNSLKGSVYMTLKSNTAANEQMSEIMSTVCHHRLCFSVCHTHNSVGPHSAEKKNIFQKCTF